MAECCKLYWPWQYRHERSGYLLVTLERVLRKIATDRKFKSLHSYCSGAPFVLGHYHSDDVEDLCQKQQECNFWATVSASVNGETIDPVVNAIHCFGYRYVPASQIIYYHLPSDAHFISTIPFCIDVASPREDGTYGAPLTPSSMAVGDAMKEKDSSGRVLTELELTLRQANSSIFIEREVRALLQREQELAKISPPPLSLSATPSPPASPRDDHELLLAGKRSLTRDTDDDDGNDSLSTSPRQFGSVGSSPRMMGPTQPLSGGGSASSSPQLSPRLAVPASGSALAPVLPSPSLPSASTVEVDPLVSHLFGPGSSPSSPSAALPAASPTGSSSGSRPPFFRTQSGTLRQRHTQTQLIAAVKSLQEPSHSPTHPQGVGHSSPSPRVTGGRAGGGGALSKAMRRTSHSIYDDSDDASDDACYKEDEVDALSPLAPARPMAPRPITPSRSPLPSTTPPLFDSALGHPQEIMSLPSSVMLLHLIRMRRVCREPLLYWCTLFLQFLVLWFVVPYKRALLWLSVHARALAPLLQLSYAARQVQRRCNKFVRWPALFIGSQLKWSNHPHRRAFKCLFLNSVSIALLDVCAGIMAGIVLWVYADDVLAFLQEFCRNVNESAIVEQIEWIMGWPAGLKLNHELDVFLGRLFLFYNSYWQYLLLSAFFPYRSLLLCAVACSGALGLSMMVALVGDIMSVVTFHVRCFYIGSARVYMFQLQALDTLWKLFRGKKWNVLRNRVDSTNYDIDQLLMGTLLFTVLFFLFPTVGVYYLYFSTLRFYLTLSHLAVAVTLQVLNHFPLYTLCMYLYDRLLFTGGVRFRLETHLNSAAGPRRSSHTNGSTGTRRTTYLILESTAAPPYSTLFFHYKKKIESLRSTYTVGKVLKSLLCGSPLV